MSTPAQRLKLEPNPFLVAEILSTSGEQLVAGASGAADLEALAAHLPTLLAAVSKRLSELADKAGSTKDACRELEDAEETKVKGLLIGRAQTKKSKKSGFSEARAVIQGCLGSVPFEAVLTEADSHALTTGSFELFEKRGGALLFPKAGYSFDREGAQTDVAVPDEADCEALRSRCGASETERQQLGEAFVQEWGVEGQGEAQSWLCAVVREICRHAEARGTVSQQCTEGAFMCLGWM